ARCAPLSSRTAREAARQCARAHGPSAHERGCGVLAQHGAPPRRARRWKTALPYFARATPDDQIHRDVVGPLPAPPPTPPEPRGSPVPPVPRRSPAPPAPGTSPAPPVPATPPDPAEESSSEGNADTPPVPDGPAGSDASGPGTGAENVGTTGGSYSGGGR